MKKSVLIVLAFISLTAYSQNKTLGVGVTIPNPNAALHVESPTGNQGFMMPRLTTTQRTAMAAILTSADAGLMVYDTQLLVVFTWNGTSWGGSSKFLPYSATLTNQDLLSTSYGLDINYTGDSSRTLLNVNFSNASNTKVANPFVVTHAGQGAAFVLTQSGVLGTGGIFSLTNPVSPSQALRATTVGTGQAGNFRINNVSSTAVSLYSETNGSGPAFHSKNIGAGDGFAGLFFNEAVTNTYPAVQASTSGTGTGVRVIQNATSVGGGMDVFMQNVTGTATGFSVEQQGMGPAASIVTNNPGNNNPVIYASSNGNGNVINSQSTSAARAGYFHNSNSGSSGPVVTVDNVGSGTSVEALNNGTGFGLYARAVGTTDAIFAQKVTGDGVGSAGNFQNSEPSNVASALYAGTNAPNGTAIGAGNSANGNALALFQGGMKLSTAAPLTSGGDITTRAFAYLISDATLPYTFPAGFLSNGDTFYFYNEDGLNNATIDGTIVIQSNSGALVIYLGGTLRAIYGGVAP